MEFLGVSSVYINRGGDKSLDKPGKREFGKS